MNMLCRIVAFATVVLIFITCMCGCISTRSDNDYPGMDWEVFTVLDGGEHLPIRITSLRKTNWSSGAVAYEYAPHSFRVKTIDGHVIEIRCVQNAPSDWVVTRYFNDGRTELLSTNRIYQGIGYPQEIWDDDRIQKPIPTRSR